MNVGKDWATFDLSTHLQKLKESFVEAHCYNIAVSFCYVDVTRVDLIGLLFSFFFFFLNYVFSKINKY